MKSLKPTILTLSLLGLCLPSQARRITYFPMEASNGEIIESESGVKSVVNAANTVESIKGIKGDAIRFDGYSTFIESELDLGQLTSFTFSLWTAMETWPIIEHDKQNETDMTCIAGNYDSETKTGFGFFVSRIGKLSFKFFSQGWPGEISSSEVLPLYQWNNLVATSDGTNASLYVNGECVGTARCKGVTANNIFRIGKSANGLKLDNFYLNTINGIIDEIEIYDEAIDTTTIQDWQTNEMPALTIVADNKYEEDIYRPRFHGMPSRNWTNETHGLIYYNNQYHLFFQKNANGPYMSRLQWGHIVSENLYDWQELPIAIGSDKWYDLKGCWSGCIAIDDEVTGGKPGIIYTGVDYARAMICQASPNDDDLLQWTKQANPIIDGKPSGLSDDFRDPYFFRVDDKAYIMVGSSKDGKGVCTLHSYNPTTKQWSNDGATFFQASNASAHGTFWEMPNLTEVDGKYIFTTTPQGTNDGVKLLYWTGNINSNGTFDASSTSATVELSGFAKDGYGLLSPSIMQIEGKTIAIGIVPDKLSSDQNYNLGWAHTYSLPREWDIDADGKLIQKPFSGLEAMRSDDNHYSMEKAINGTESLGEMKNRQFEVKGEFIIGDYDFGYSFFKKDDKEARLTYSPSSGKLTLDLRTLDRIKNDERIFNGVYETSLPTTLTKGSTMTIHIFVDHSIMDIFINNQWASSVRIFPKDSEANTVEAFSEGGLTQANVSIWSLDPKSSSIVNIFSDTLQEDESPYVDVYDFSGSLIRKNMSRIDATEGLLPGFYIIGNKKVYIR